MWETDGKKTNQFRSTYWRSENTPGCSDDGRVNDYSDIKVKNLDDPDGFGGYNNMNLSNKWLIFGVDWDMWNIRWYLNNVLTKSYVIPNTYDNANPCKLDMNDQPIYSKNIRIGTGPNSIGDRNDPFYLSDLPKTMYVDYVRVYVKNGFDAVKFTQVPTDMCIGSSGNVSCTYYPGATYVWDSPIFTFGPNDYNIQSSRWAVMQPSAMVGQTYPVTVTVTFPSGYIETHTKYVYISDFPSVPAGGVNTIRIGSSCNYQAKYVKSNANENILWSEDGGTTWEPGINS